MADKDQAPERLWLERDPGMPFHLTWFDSRISERSISYRRDDLYPKPDNSDVEDERLEYSTTSPESVKAFMDILITARPEENNLRAYDEDEPDRAVEAASLVKNEFNKDRQRLEVLMEHPDKLWIDASGGKRMYCGAAVDGDVGRGIWRDNPRDAVDDIIQRVERG